MQYELIKPYIEKKLVSENPHPEDPDVRIFNYTQACQFAQAWDDVTRHCRGLIMNVKTGEVLARPFPKFFNYGEHVSKGWPIPTEEPIITDKLDGSLGILYHLNGIPYIATRGSFISDQAQWATAWWREHVNKFDRWNDGMTHLFEIIYPANRIVVNYDYSGLVHIASLNVHGYQFHTDERFGPAREVRQIPPMALDELAKMDEPNSEGFVLFYPKANVRMKIKFPEYVRLHKLITGVNEIAIWEHLRDGKTLDDLLEKVPDEFFQWVTETIKKLRIAYEAIDTQAHEDYWTTVGSDDPYIVGARASWRKDFAIKAQKCKYPAIMFAKLDEKPIAPIIWKMVRPSGSHVFKTDIDL